MKRGSEIVVSVGFVFGGTMELMSGRSGETAEGTYERWERTLRDS